MTFDRSVPPVVAVVVTARPGPWFEETLRSVGGQDYPNLSVLVVDAGGDDDPTAGDVLARRVAATCPGAYLRRAAGPPGFAAGANEVIGLVEGASHYLICHDDVAPDVDALRLLVEEAFRSNAGIVAAKLVDWDQPDRLRSVGAGIDRLGNLEALVERDELDQGQHDTPADVFVAPGGAVLVRADLFDALGGFDPTLPKGGEDLDLCWRALVAGARVRVAPAARVRHLEVRDCGLPDGPEARLAEDRSRWPTLLVCASPATLAWLLPLGMLLALGEATASLATGRFGHASGVLGAALGPWRRPVSLWRSRRRTQRRRRVHDHRLRSLQVTGSGRFRSWVARRDEAVPSPAAPVVPGDSTSQSVTDVRRGAGRQGATPVGATLAALVAFLLIGSRGVLLHHLPAVGSIPADSGGIGAWWRSWLSTWRPAGLGSPGSGPPALGLLVVARVLSFGWTGLLRHLVVLGPLLVGPLGAYRLARPWGSARARAVALVAYAACPLPYDAFAWGRWGALIVYAAAPWTVAALARLSDTVPYQRLASRRRFVGGVATVGILTAVTAAVAPSWLVVVPVASGALALGSLLAARAPSAGRLALTGAAAAAVALVLLLPWSAGVVGHASALFGPGPGPGGAASFARLLRFGIGPVGTGTFGWGLLAAAALPLAIGRSWRLEWAVRLWTLALVCFGWAYLSGAGVLASPPVDVLLAPAAVGLAGSVAVGVAAFEQDLPGYRFGWRQAASAVAAVGLVLALLPSLGDAVGGRWQLPTAGPSSALASLDGASGGDYRVLWIGDPRAIPLASSRFEGGLGWAMSFDGLPGVADTWTGGAVGGASAVSRDLDLARNGLTSQLGQLLAPLGVRYLVVPRFDAPSGSGAARVAVPGAVIAGLRRQTDLEQVGSDPHYLVYADAAWIPVRAEMAGSVALPARVSPGELVSGGLGPPRDALSGDSASRATGVVSPGERIYVSATYSPGWRLLVDHRSLRPSRALGVGMAWTVPAGVSGVAVLRAGGEPLLEALQWAVVGLWVLVAAGALASRRGGGRPGDGVGATGSAPSGASRDRAGSSRRQSIPAVGSAADEELWADD